MITTLTAQDLIKFEEDIAQTFETKVIRAPIHLYSNCEEQMLEAFELVQPDDWVLCTWRSHYQCLLKGVPEAQVKQAIVDGKSICLCFPEYRVISSAIVTGTLPIAVGIALGIKRSGGKNKVHCWIGDMTSETGCAWECFKYSFYHKLPIRFVIEDNNQSGCTDTRQTWNMKTLTFEGGKNEMIHFYKYKSKWPHSGAGKRIQF